MQIKKRISTMWPFSYLDTAEAWQNAGLIGTVIAFTIAFAIAATNAAITWQVNKVKKVESKQKDEKIALEFKAKEVLIANADAEAAKANEGLAKSNEEIARLTAETEQSKLERAEANKQIEIAKADAARAKEGIANAEARSVEASAEVSRLRVIVANAEQKRAEAERALLELQQRVAPRTITAEKRTQMLEKLKPAPKGTIEVTWVYGNNEAGDFASQIAEVMATAGWNVTIGGGIIQVGTYRNISISAPRGRTQEAAVLLSALSSIGFPTESILMGGPPEQRIGLFVPQKPSN